MDTRRAWLRGTAALALAVAIVGSSALAPSASAASLTGDQSLHSVAQKTKKDEPAPSSEADSGGGGGLSDIPIIGDVVGQAKDDPVNTAVQFASVAVETGLPLIRSLIK